MFSMMWCSPCLVILPCRPQSAAWCCAIRSPGTVAAPGEWSTWSALHCSHIVAICPHVLQALNALAFPHVLHAHDGSDIRHLGNMCTCIGNRRAFLYRQACLAFLYACGPWPTEDRRMRGSPESSIQGGRIRSHRTRGTPEPSQQVWSHDKCGGFRALPIREARSGATGHVVASEPTLAGRKVPVLYDTWWHVGARPAPCLDLKLVCRGTQSIGYR
jgi:hypothetical protein